MASSTRLGFASNLCASRAPALCRMQRASSDADVVLLIFGDAALLRRSGYTDARRVILGTRSVNNLAAFDFSQCFVLVCTWCWRLVSELEILKWCSEKLFIIAKFWYQVMKKR